MGSNVTKSTTPQNTLVCKKKKRFTVDLRVII